MEHHNRKARDKLSRYLKNKRVVIVGPAPGIIGSNQGKLIDSYDIVVRLNKGFPVPPKFKDDLGTRTDILYNCMNPSEECGGIISVSQLKKKGVNFLVGAYPPVEKMGNTRLRLKKDVQDFFGKNRMRFQNFCYTDKGYFQKLWKHMKLPNTGVMAIADLLRFDLKELYITGITFFKGGYYQQYRPYDENGILEHMKKFGLHKPEKELRYMAPILSEDQRVIMDNTLKDIVNKCNEINETDEGGIDDEAENDEAAEVDEADEAENDEADEAENDEVDETENDEVDEVENDEAENDEAEKADEAENDEEFPEIKKQSANHSDPYNEEIMTKLSSKSVNLYVK